MTHLPYSFKCYRLFQHATLSKMLECIGTDYSCLPLFTGSSWGKWHSLITMHLLIYYMFDYFFSAYFLHTKLFTWWDLIWGNNNVHTNTSALCAFRRHCRCAHFVLLHIIFLMAHPKCFFSLD